VALHLTLAGWALLELGLRVEYFDRKHAFQAVGLREPPVPEQNA
jgi:hypothetical protein